MKGVYKLEDPTLEYLSLKPTMERKINDYKREIATIRKRVKPYGYSIRFRIGYYANTDYTIELFKGYCHNTNKVWESYGWYNTWMDFDDDVDSLNKYIEKYIEN